MNMCAFLGAPSGIVSLGRLAGIALRTRIKGNHVIFATQRVDLRLPDVRRHCPAGNKDDRPPLPAFDEVQAHPITRDKRSIGRHADRGERKNQHQIRILHGYIQYLLLYF